MFWVYLSLSLFVRGRVLSATSSPPHLIVFSTLPCLLSSSSSLPPLLSSSHISQHNPPISALASLVSSCPPHVTLPLSSVVCHPPSFLDTLHKTIILSQFLPLQLDVQLFRGSLPYGGLCAPLPSIIRRNSVAMKLSPSIRITALNKDVVTTFIAQQIKRCT